MRWTLNEGLLLIRKLQPKAFELNFYLALAGGVLNNGQSDNDIDLVAVNNSPSSSAKALMEMMDHEFQLQATTRLVNGRLHLRWDHIKVECLVIEPLR